MSHPVKWFDSTMGGAPVLSGRPGAIIALLDACLINGFNVLTPSSMTVSGGVATVAYSTAHGYLQHQVIEVSGATPDGLNGERRVLSVVDINTITIDATGIADGTASGTISTRAAPVGTWEKVYSGTNKAVYRCTDPSSTRLYLRVDDTDPYDALVRGYESMSDVDTGVGEFPTTAQMSSGWSWRKSSSANATARRWRIFSDGRFFHLMARWSSNTPYGAAWYLFGDIRSYKPGDAYHCAIGGHLVKGASEPGSSPTPAECYGDSNVMSIARSHAQTGSPVYGRRSGSRLCAYFGIYGQPYPSPVDGGLLLHAPVHVTEGGVTSPLRGALPGVLQPVQTAPLTDGAVVSDLDGLPGRTIMLVQIDYNGLQGRVAFDITGPWR